MPYEENPPVVFTVRFGKEQFTCRGHLVDNSVDEMPDDCPFPPDRVKIEEGDLELKQDESGRDWYQYHGFIFIY